VTWNDDVKDLQPGDDERVDSLLMLSADCYWEQDGECRFTLVRASAARFAAPGTMADWLGMAPWQLPGVDPDSADMQRLRAAVAAGQPYQDLELAIATPGGGVQRLLMSAAPRPDAEGRCAGYRGVARDVTRERQELAELRRFRSAIDICSEPICLIDRETMRIVDANATACAASGRDRESLLQMGPHQWLVREREVIEREYDEAIAQAPEPVRVEGHARHHDGREYAVELTRRAVRIEGRWTIVTVGRDITLRKHAEEAAQRLGRMYATLGATNEAMLHSRSVEQLYLQVCQAAVKGSGFITASVVVPAEDDPDRGRVVAVAGRGRRLLQNQLIALNADCPEGQGLVGSAYRNRKPCVTNDFMADGRLLPWHAAAMHGGVASAAAVPLLRDGRSYGVLLLHSVEPAAFVDEVVDLLVRMADNIGFVLDHLEHQAQRDRAMAELHLSEEKYRGILENMADGYFEVDLSGNYTAVNEALARIHGRPAESLLGLNYRRYLDPDTSARVLELFNRIYRTGETGHIGEWPLIRADGSVTTVENAIQLVRDAEGRAVQFRGVTRDITGRRRAEDALRASEAKYRSILESIEEAYYEVDLKGNLLLCNSAFAALLGRPMDGLAGLHYSQYIPQAMQRSVFASFNQVYRTGNASKDVDWPMQHVDGHTALTEGSIHLITDVAGEATGFRGILRDVTQRRHMESALRESEKRFRDLTQLSSDWYWEQGPDHRFTLVSDKIAPTTGLAAAACLGRALWDFDWLPVVHADWSAFRAVLSRHEAFRGLVLRRASPLRYVSLNGQPVFGAGGQFQGYRGTGTDITERRLAEERIRHIARHDALTDLPNRAAFGEILSDAVAASARFGHSFALMFIDLDGFKAVNDGLGHDAGDAVLKETARRLAGCVRASDVVARLGGDEFTVLLRDIDSRDTATAVACKLIEEAAHDIALPSGVVCRVTASIGLSVYPDDGADEQLLLKRADAAMYRAKQGGKNRLAWVSQAGIGPA
jgi:diguanylate cyclase (GGDEF)-like protein/PAS domain S-box-containing protein